MAIVRRAEVKDARGIHNAHMRSICEQCSLDHSLEEIAVWGTRPFNEQERINAIQNHNVWVVEEDQEILGYGHLMFSRKENKTFAHVMGLYLTPEVSGIGIGGSIIRLMIAVAEAANAESIRLDSTITARMFYRRIGFEEQSDISSITIAGQPIRCIPMQMDLNSNQNQLEFSVLAQSSRGFVLSQSESSA